MINHFLQKISQNWQWTLASVAIGGLLFGSGYWLGVEKSRTHNAMPMVTQAIPMQRHLAGPGPAGGIIAPSTMALPPNASPELKEFLQNRMILAEKVAQLRSQNPNGAQDPRVMAGFQHDNAALLDRQKQLYKIISQQPIPDPAPLQIPVDATPAMKAFLTTRDQLMRDQIKIMNEHRTDDPKVRQAAMQAWRQQNAALFEQLRQEAQALNLAKPT